MINHLDNTDYAILGIQHNYEVVEDKVLLTFEIHYSERTIDYHKLLYGTLLPKPDGFAIYTFDLHLLGLITQYLNPALIDTSYYSVNELGDFYIISHLLLHDIIKNNFKLFRTRYLQNYDLDTTLKILKHTLKNTESIQNIMLYHENRYTDYTELMKKGIV